MFGSTVLDLALGLIFTFLMVSLVTSVGTEGIASACSWRANTLLDGVKKLVNDPQFTGLARSLYNHALVNSQAAGDAQTEAALSVRPSYIDSKHFASAMIDIVGLAPGATMDQLHTKINTDVADPQLRKMLNGIVDRTGGNINRIRDEIGTWFDGGMERVAGVYKRRTQLWSFGIALIVTVALNIDAVAIADALWHQPMMIKTVSPPPDGETALKALQQFTTIGLPYGWDANKFHGLWTLPNLIFVLVGWLLTAGATLFGAPFWFDSLQKFVQLRGAGSS